MWLPQGKLQKHQAFEAEVQANSAAIVKLDDTGNLMISEGHFASETIRVRLLPLSLLHTDVKLLTCSVCSSLTRPTGLSTSP